MGTEIYWHGILDYDNRDNRKLAEVKKIHQRVEKMKEITGAQYKAAFGVIRDYSNVWDAQVDKWHQRLAWTSEEEIFIGAQLSHTPMDYVYLLDSTEVEELLKYPVLIYPHPMILSEKKAELLRRYAEEGGCLILGARTGLKDETGKCVMDVMPGLLKDITGTTVEEFTFLGPADDQVSMEWEGKQVETGIFNDILAAGPGAKVLASYSSNYYQGRPALIENHTGKGKVLHFGGTFTRENIKDFLAYGGVLSAFKELVELPEMCELCVREKDGKQYIIILNYSPEEQKAVLKVPVTDLDTGDKVQGQAVLKGYETKVYCCC